MRFFASCGKGLEYLLADELAALGCTRATAAMAGVNVEGTLADAQRAVLWSRLASRVLWPIAEFDCPDEHALYNGVSALAWPEHLAQGDTLAVDAHVGDGTGLEVQVRAPDLVQVGQELFQLGHMAYIGPRTRFL